MIISGLGCALDSGWWIVESQHLSGCGPCELSLLSDLECGFIVDSDYDHLPI